MGSIVCSRCGQVRFDPSARCPGCGAAGPPPETGAGFVGALTGVGASPNLPEPWRARGEPTGWNSPTVRRHVAEAIAVTVVLLVMAATYTYAVGGFRPPPPAPQVLVPDHGTWPSTNSGGSSGWGFTANFNGTLEGGFVDSNGTVEVCLTRNGVFGTPSDPVPTSCPSNATYSSGFVASGQVRAGVAAGLNWLQVFPALNPDGGPQGNWNLTWSPALEIVPG